MVAPKNIVQKLAPYLNGKHSSLVFEKGAKLLKLDSNESGVAPSPGVIGALTEFIQSGALNWYPDIESRALMERLASYTGLPVDHIQTFNGSDNALETVCRTYIELHDEVVLCMPTYDHFRLYAETCDAKLVYVHGPSPFAPKMDQLISALTDRTKIVYIVNPNNPTGMLYSEVEIRRLCEAAPKCLIIVDEAYFEFCGMTMSGLVGQYSNLLITRSFSKAFGLAGLRLGYVLTNPANLASINKIRIGKNINTLAQIAAAASLDNREYMESYVSEVGMARQWLATKLEGMGVKIILTPANYILVEVSNPNEVLNFLEENNIYIRDRSMLKQLENYVRITIGSMLQMERFWRVFKTIPQVYLFGQDLGLQFRRASS